MDSPKHTLIVLGDSQTALLSSYGVLAPDMWPGALCDKLKLVGYDIKPRVFGVSGNTSAQVLDRADIMFKYDKPSMAAIYCGVNDVGTLTAAQTKANTQALIKAAKYCVFGEEKGTGGPVYVASQTNLPANSLPGTRYVVMVDSSTNGGRAKSADYQHDTIPGAGNNAQTVWEVRNKQSGESGWGRVAIAGTPAFKEGIPAVLVISTNYRNWTTGGDSYNVIANSGTQVPAYQTIRTATKEAADADGAAYVDLYGFQSRLIYGAPSETAQGSFSWHVSDGDQHHNAYGHESVARAAYDKIVSLKSAAPWIPKYFS